jgi:ketosteroid isomerase-like protein
VEVYQRAAVALMCVYERAGPSRRNRPAGDREKGPMLQSDAALLDGQVTTPRQARRLVERWTSAWNDHDLDAILECYRDDVELRSPFVRRVDGGDVGVLCGKDSLREYFASALERFPALHLDVREVVAGPGQVTVSYRGVSNLLSTETMRLAEDGRVHQVDIQYRATGV